MTDFGSMMLVQGIAWSWQRNGRKIESSQLDNSRVSPLVLGLSSKSFCNVIQLLDVINLVLRRSPIERSHFLLIQIKYQRMGHKKGGNEGTAKIQFPFADFKLKLTHTQPIRASLALGFEQ
jgi:hypothetical protein